MKNTEATVRSLQMLHAIVKDLHADCVRIREEMHASDESYPLFKLWCELCERRSSARKEFFEQRNRFVSVILEESGVAGHYWGDNWREGEKLFPELYES